MLHVPFITIAIPLILIWTFYRIIIFKKSTDFNKPRELFLSLFYIYFLIVINLTFFKQGYLILTIDRFCYVNLIPFVKTIAMFEDNFMGIGNSLYNVIRNILLFIPLGFFIPLLFNNKNRLSNTILYGIVFSLLIESLQFLTGTNLTDIDDIIFNTLGSVIGLFIFNMFIKLINKTRLTSYVYSLQSHYVGNVLVLIFKLLSPIILVTITLLYTGLYFSTTSGKLTNKAIAKDVFSYNTYNNYVYFTNFDTYKLFLTDYDNHINLLTAKKVLHNRWIQYGGTHEIDLSNNHFLYSISTLYENNCKNLDIVVFGKNFDAQYIEITFKGKKFSQELKANDYFIIPFPTFERISQNTDMYNILEGKESKDLIIKFKEKDGTECNHIRITNTN